MSGGDIPKEVPLVGHAIYDNNQTVSYEFEWENLYEKHGAAAFDINLGLMPKDILVCGCAAK